MKGQTACCDGHTRSQAPGTDTELGGRTSQSIKATRSQSIFSSSTAHQWTLRFRARINLPLQVDMRREDTERDPRWASRQGCQAARPEESKSVHLRFCWFRQLFFCPLICIWIFFKSSKRYRLDSSLSRPLPLPLRRSSINCSPLVSCFLTCRPRAHHAARPFLRRAILPFLFFSILSICWKKFTTAPIRPQGAQVRCRRTRPVAQGSGDSVKSCCHHPWS